MQLYTYCIGLADAIEAITDLKPPGRTIRRKVVMIWTTRIIKSRMPHGNNRRTVDSGPNLEFATDRRHRKKADLP
jgi:hypothetical protein